MEKKQEDRTNGRWTRLEHQMFLQGLQIHGKNWKKIEQMIGTRTGSQIRSHAQKFFLKFEQKNAKEGQESQKLTMEQICEGGQHESSNLSVEEKDSYGHEYDTDISYFCHHMNKLGKEHSLLTDVKELNFFDFWQNCIEVPKVKELSRSHACIPEKQNEMDCEEERKAESMRKIQLERRSFVLVQGDAEKRDKLMKLRNLQ